MIVKTLLHYFAMFTCKHGILYWYVHTVRLGYLDKAKENTLGSNDSSSSGGIPNHQQECKSCKRHNQHLFYMGLLSHDNKKYQVAVTYF